MAAETGEKTVKPTWRQAMQDAYWAVCCYVYYALWKAEYAHPDLESTLKQSRLDGLRMLLDLLEEEGTEYTYWPEGMWEASSPEGIKTLPRERVLKILPELQPLTVDDFAPGHPPEKLFAAAAKVRKHPALAFAMTHMGVTFAERLIRGMFWEKPKEQSEARRVVAAAFEELIPKVGYRDCFPVDFMKIYVRVKYKYDFDDIYPSDLPSDAVGADMDLADDDDVEDPGLVPGLDDDPNSPDFAEWRARDARVEAQIRELKRQGYVQQEGESPEQVAKEFIKERRKAMETSDDIVDNYVCTDDSSGSGTPSQSDGPASKASRAVENKGPLPGFDFEALNAMRSDALATPPPPPPPPSPIPTPSSAASTSDPSNNVKGQRGSRVYRRGTARSSRLRK